MSINEEYYQQGQAAFVTGQKCSYSPSSARGIAWSNGYNDALLLETLFEEGEEDYTPTLEEAQNAVVVDPCECDDEEC
jgi:hypothetical protein